MLIKAFYRLIAQALPKISYWKFAFSLLFVAGLYLSLVLGSCTKERSLNSTPNAENSPSNNANVVRIGHQPQGAFLLLKVRGNLEKRLASMGLSVEWQEFPASFPMLVAMGEGKIDLGHGGVVPPIVAQANNVPFVYVANDTALPGSIGILVRKDSPIRTLADLKGKKIAAAKASAGQYLLVQALIKEGLTLENVEFVDLPPSQGQAALKQGKVDAWVGWQPFLAELQESMPVRLLTNAEGLINDRNFYFAASSFANEREDIVNIVMEEARQVGIWAMNYPNKAAEILTRYTGLKASAALRVTKSRRYEAIPIQDRAIEDQQRIAETFFRLGLLPKRILVEDAVWKQG